MTRTLEQIRVGSIFRAAACWSLLDRRLTATAVCLSVGGESRGLRSPRAANNPAPAPAPAPAPTPAPTSTPPVPTACAPVATSSSPAATPARRLLVSSRLTSCWSLNSRRIGVGIGVRTGCILSSRGQASYLKSDRGLHAAVDDKFCRSHTILHFQAPRGDCTGGDGHVHQDSVTEHAVGCDVQDSSVRIPPPPRRSQHVQPD